MRTFKEISVYLMVLAVVLTALKFFEIGPFARMDWWWILGVYGLTAAWWAFADASGYTKRKAAEKMDKAKADRIARQRKELGLGIEQRRR